MYTLKPKGLNQKNALLRKGRTQDLGVTERRGDHWTTLFIRCSYLLTRIYLKTAWLFEIHKKKTKA